MNDEHEEWALEQLADGVTLNKTSARLEERLGVRVTRDQLARYYEMTDDRSARYVEAMRRGAGGMADRAIEVIDDADPTPSTGEVTKAKAMSDVLRWSAAKRDPEKYEEKKGPGVVLEIGALHLDALRVKGAPAAQVMKVIEPALLVAGEDDPAT
jgi:hypothetical protein